MWALKIPGLSQGAAKTMIVVGQSEENAMNGQTCGRVERAEEMSGNREWRGLCGFEV